MGDNLKKESEIFIENILRPYIGKIVVFPACDDNWPKWRKQKKLYLYEGWESIVFQNEREILPNEVILEFDKSPGIESTLPQRRNQAFQYIRNIITQYFIPYRYKYWLTDHGGNSPHLRFLIDGIEHLEPIQRSRYKEMIVKDLLQIAQYDDIFNIIQPDYSLIRAKHKPIPLELKQHYKTKYNGDIEDIIEHSPISWSSMTARQDYISKIASMKSPTLSRNPTNTTLPVGFYPHKITGLFEKYYKKGQRSLFLLGFSALMKRNNIDKDYLIQQCQDLFSQGQYKDIKIIDSTYTAEIISPRYWFNQFMEDNEIPCVYRDILSCINFNHNDL